MIGAGGGDKCSEEDKGIGIRQTFRNKTDTNHGIYFNYIRCMSSCNVSYGGMYTATKGFAQALNNECSQIGFRCRQIRVHPNS